MRISLDEVVGKTLAAAYPGRWVDIDMHEVTPEAFQAFLSETTSFQQQVSHVKAGHHRLNDWATGWAQNLDAFRSSADPKHLLPKYFGKYPEVRLGGRLFRDATGSAELTLLRTLQTCAVMFAKSIVPYESLFEFGAGTGHNLLNFGADRSLRALGGYEWSWSGVDCIREIGRTLDERVTGHFFDYYAPQLTSDLGLSSACVVTVASLEQIGSHFRPFLEFLRRAGPRIVVNIEPIQELMGEGPLAVLSKEYARQRNYLEGFYDYLGNLQRAGVIEILLEQTSLIGSKYINGYGILIWRWTR